MKTIEALVALTCLLGIASAQTMFTGEGYSSSQLAFYNAPSSPTFEPDVEKYWGTYITGAGNLTKSSPMSDMEIWMNTFPLKFSTPLKLTGSSFTANVQAPSLTQTELTSQFLTREVTGQFGIYEVKAYKPVIGSLSSQNATGVPGENAKGQILSQSIISLFSV